MSKLSKIPKVMPLNQNNLVGSGNLSPSVKLIRSEARSDIFNKLKTIAPNSPMITKDGLYLCQRVTNLHTANRTNNFSGWGLHNSTIGDTTTSATTLDGRKAVAMIRNNLKEPTVSTSFISMPVLSRNLNSRYHIGCLVKPVGKLLTSKGSYIYLRWQGKVGATNNLSTVYLYSRTGEFFFTEVADYDVRGGAIPLDDGWYYLWLTTGTPAGSTDAAGINTEIGCSTADIIADAGEELMYLDLLQIQEMSSFMLPVISNNGAVTTYAEDVVYTEHALLSGNSLYIEFNAEDYSRVMSFSGTLITIGAGSTDLMLVREGDVLKLYSEGSYIGQTAFTNNSPLIITVTAGAFYIKCLRLYGALFDDVTVPLVTFKSPGIAFAFAKALPGAKKIVGTTSDVMAVISEATGITLNDSDVEIITASPFYLEYGAKTVIRVRAKKDSKLWSGYVDVAIKGTLESGIGYWEVSLSGGAVLGTTLNKPILRLKGTHQTGLNAVQFNSYHYDIFNNQLSYVVKAGDTLQYDIYFPADNTIASMDCNVSGAGDAVLRHHEEIYDQNRMSSHPGEPIHVYATRKWFTRIFNLTPIAGCTLYNWSIALENEGDITTIVYLRNVVIKNAAGVVVAAPFLDTLVVPQSMTWEGGGSVNYKDILKAVLTPAEAIGIVPII